MAVSSAVNTGCSGEIASASPAVVGSKSSGEGTRENLGGLVARGQQVYQSLPQLAIIAAFPIQEFTAVGRGRQVEGGVEQGFHLARVKRHRGGLQGWFP